MFWNPEKDQRGPLQINYFIIANTLTRGKNSVFGTSGSIANLIPTAHKRLQNTRKKSCVASRAGGRFEQ